VDDQRVASIRGFQDISAEGVHPTRKVSEQKVADFNVGANGTVDKHRRTAVDSFAIGTG
jgi:hypothetical protein